MALSLLTHFFRVQELYFRSVSNVVQVFGKTIVHPRRRELFEKVTGLSVSHSTSSGFLTRAESETVVGTAKRHNLIGTHIDAVLPNTSGGRGRGNGRNSRRGARKGVGRGGS